jgi:hypothetical protein
MEFVKLKDEVNFEKLTDFGFVEDDSNCEKGDVYYHLNNYYVQAGKDFRVTVNILDRHIDVLCLAQETGVHNIFNVKPLFELLTSGLVEIVKK